MTPEPLHLRLSEGDVRTLDRYWRAANYLAACQIYLMDNPLLSEPLRPRQVKPRPRLLGHDRRGRDRAAGRQLAQPPVPRSGRSGRPAGRRYLARRRPRPAGRLGAPAHDRRQNTSPRPGPASTARTLPEVADWAWGQPKRGT